MAIDDWIDFDCDDDYFYEQHAFSCPCKWCGTPITMTPQEDGSWKPMKGLQVHVCEKRIDQELAQAVASMVTLSDTDCQFCGTPMEWRDVLIDLEDGPRFSSPKKHLHCPGCGACGPTQNQ